MKIFFLVKHKLRASAGNVNPKKLLHFSKISWIPSIYESELLRFGELNIIAHKARVIYIDDGYDNITIVCTMYEDAWVAITASKAEFFYGWAESLPPSMSSLFQFKEGMVQEQDFILLTFDYESLRLFHINGFVKFSIKESTFDVKGKDLPVFESCNCKQYVYCLISNNWGENFIVVNPFSLAMRWAFLQPSDLIANTQWFLTIFAPLGKGTNS